MLSLSYLFNQAEAQEQFLLAEFYIIICCLQLNLLIKPIVNSLFNHLELDNDDVLIVEKCIIIIV